MKPIDGDVLTVWLRKNADKLSKYGIVQRVENAPVLSGEYIHRDTRVRIMVEHFYPNPTMARYDFLNFFEGVPSIYLDEKGKEKWKNNEKVYAGRI